MKYFLALILISSFHLMAKADTMLIPNSKTQLKLHLAQSQKEQTKGLSGLKKLPQNEGMLFINKNESIRQFWMPDTYFNLDIIFLDHSLKIVAIERNVPAHPGRNEPPEIYRTKGYFAQYVLEVNANAPFAKTLKVSDQLQWETKSDTHHQK